MYKFKPILKTLVWGTEKWVLSGVPGNESIVAEGPEAGRTLNEIYGGEFPILIKFIDARQDLSIQVHPNDELARARHGCNGKTEMWYVIDSNDGYIISGFSKEVSLEEYKARVQNGTIAEVLEHYPIRKDDVFFLPAGRIHAIGGGSHIAEIQQTSGITYRIYDYNRPGLDGKPRELHTNLAVGAIDWGIEPDYRTNYASKINEGIEIVKCPYFTTELYELTGTVRTDISKAGPFLIVICLEGKGTVNGTEIKAGEAALILKEEKEAIFSPAGSMKLLTSRI